MVAKKLKDNVRAKELFVKAQRYALASGCEPDNTKRIPLVMAHANAQLIAERRYSDSRNRSGDGVPVRVASSDEAIYSLRDAINLAKSLPGVTEPVRVANESIDTLIRNGFFAEAIMFRLQLELGNIGDRIPEDAIARYEKVLDFKSCAIVARELERKREIEFYEGLSRIKGYERSTKS